MNPRSKKPIHEVVIAITDDVIAADVTTAVEVFERTRLGDGTVPYRVKVASSKPTVDAGAFAIRAPWRLDALDDADTVIVPGRADPTAPTPRRLAVALRSAHERGARIVSICVGTFILADVGILDGRRATTHWAAADELARLHPDVFVDANVLFVDGGQICSSAGASAGFDLCLHLVESDHGSDVAAQTARALVMPVRRRGGQAQFITRKPPASDGADLAPLLEWLQANHQRPLSLDDIARRASMSTRTLHRRFAEHVGMTPNGWLREVRIRRSQELLETTSHTIEDIAHSVGFGSATTFRTNFMDVVGVSPTAYRKAFSAAHARSGAA